MRSSAKPRSTLFTRPFHFNKDLPRSFSPNGKVLLMLMGILFEHTEQDNAWPTNGLKWKLYHTTNLFGRVKGNLSNFSSNYFGIWKLSKNISTSQESVLAKANWKLLQIHILFDLFFAMKTKLQAIQTLNKYLSFGESEMCFYNPYWLAAYVFAPINTIKLWFTIWQLLSTFKKGLKPLPNIYFFWYSSASFSSNILN
jgi:hypothetical protein